MRLDKTGLDFIRSKEGFREYAYSDGIRWAIGYGNTFYENGVPVKRGDFITKERAEKLFEYIAQDFERQVDARIVKALTQNQFNALVSYAYNRGIGSFERSVLLQMVNTNPDNIRIREQFAIEWGTNTKYKKGLIARRKAEANLYFSDSSVAPLTGFLSSEYLNLIILIFIVIGLSWYFRHKNYTNGKIKF